MTLEVALIMLLSSVRNGERRGLEFVVAGKVFVFFRRYGLRGLGALLKRMVVARDFRFLRKYVYNRGRIRGAFFFILVTVLFFSTLTWIGIVSIVSLLVAEAWLWQWGLRYVAVADSENSYKLPCLHFPELARSIRDRLALRVFWYGTFKYRLTLATCAVWIFLALDAVVTPIKSERIADAAGIFTVLLISPFIFSLTQRIMERELLFDRIVTEACFLLDPTVSSPKSKGRQYSSQIDDPLENRRTDLGNLVGRLSDAARMLDARQVRGIAPHPVSTLLRAGSQYLWRFLSNERSLSATIPDDVSDVLRSTVMVLVMPGEPASRQALLQHAKAFDEDGNPIVNLEIPPLRRLAVATNRMAAAIAGIQTPLVNLATIAVIFAVVILFAVHRLNIIDALHSMP